MYSFFDTFKIGLGPSSSHTMGPMLAARHFREQLADHSGAESIRVSCVLYGSLGATGSGHGSIKAITAGLDGHEPAAIDHEDLQQIWARVSRTHTLRPLGQAELHFNPETDLSLSEDRLPLHSNGIGLSAHVNGAQFASATYYSIGGGVIADVDGQPIGQADTPVPLPFNNAAELLGACEHYNLSISAVAWQNECAQQDEERVATGIASIWAVMSACIKAGLKADGILPGELGVKRRARTMRQRLSDPSRQQPFSRDQRAVVYAMAVNEENASGHRVVTAPTNGAAGIIPAVLQFCLDDLPAEHHGPSVRNFLLTASAIGSLFKRNASISGAEVGCQGEVGAASSMAAAGLTAVWGGTPPQIEHAAEIALEHNLGLTCDPIGGYVQIPCIERNGMGAMKAITAARIALAEDGVHLVSLDAAIETMRLTGLDMHEKYKETARGGLAVSGMRIPVTNVDC